MNLEFAKEVGYRRFFLRKFLWRCGMAPEAMSLATGSSFPLPRSSFFASDAYVSAGNVDWNSEYIMASFLGEQPEKRDFLDVGAHIGYYSALMSPLVCRVFSFEPDERNHPRLSATLSGLGNATLVPMAASDSNGPVSFSEGKDSSISHMDPERGPGEGRTTEAVTIDSYSEASGLNPIAVKIDIEGYDILALRGAIGTAKSSAPVFLVEYNQEDGRPNTWEALDDFLKSAGLIIFCVSRVSRSWRDYTYTFAPREIREMPGLSTKMLFLVPPIHQAWFTNRAATQGTWSGDGLLRTS